MSGLGSAAEDAALHLLKERNLETRRHAFNLLKQIGTVRGLESLRDQMLEREAK